MAMIVIRIVLICLISSIITEAKPVSNADLICLKPFDFIKNLVKELVADQKIELLCQLGKNLEGLAGEIKSEEDDEHLHFEKDGDCRETEVTWRKRPRSAGFSDYPRKFFVKTIIK